MGLWKRKPKLTREEALAAIPVRNLSVSASRDDSGNVLLALERRKDWRGRLVSLVFHVPRKKVIELDERGSFVWNLIDGQMAVRQIVEHYQQRYVRDLRNRKEAELQVVEFLRMLGAKRLIAMAILKPQGSDKDAKRQGKTVPQTGPARPKPLRKPA